MKKLFFSVLILTAASAASGQNRWAIQPDGKTLRLEVGENKLPHYDHMEMSGERMSLVLRWHLDRSGVFSEERSLIFPMLRTIPNNTRASLMYRIAVDIPSLLSVNQRTLLPTGTRYMEIDGAMRVISEYRASWTWMQGRDSGAPLEITRTIFPSTDLPAMCELYEIKNTGNKAAELIIPEFSQSFATPKNKGVDGTYIIRADITGSGNYTLKPGESMSFGAIFQGYALDSQQPVFPDAAAEYAKRIDFISRDIDSNLILETPDEVINTGFRYAKIRGAESIFKTKGGYMHSPGGESYYAAVWANDQAEYINPFFPYLGYGTGNESALNSFRHWFKHMNPEYKYLPSSIIAEGDDAFGVAGDRGDAAMIAYGALRYALARADKAEAQELWPLIEWCLEYCNRQLNEAGVVKSDSDELERRFPSGEANLCTSSLYYDALVSVGYLGKEIGLPTAQINKYKAQASVLRKAICDYFEAEVSGYETYRYYEGNDVLRSWICMPLIVGINDRAEGTVAALFGPELYTSDGCLTAEGSRTFWDRSTLYSFRGAYQAGYRDLATKQLSAYSTRRLLGDHVPYPIEAWPEGSQRHLSAESGLYCRVITEGLFGMRPTGFRSFTLTPQLPSDWDHMTLRHIRAFGSDFDIAIVRTKDKKIKVTVAQKDGKTKIWTVGNGATIKVAL